MEKMETWNIWRSVIIKIQSHLPRYIITISTYPGFPNRILFRLILYQPSSLGSVYGLSLLPLLSPLRPLRPLSSHSHPRRHILRQKVLFTWNRRLAAIRLDVRLALARELFVPIGLSFFDFFQVFVFLLFVFIGEVVSVWDCNISIWQGTSTDACMYIYIYLSIYLCIRRTDDKERE